MRQKIALLCGCALESALSRLMRLNPHLQHDFQALNGNVIEIQLTQLPWPLFFICNDEILVLTHYEADASVSLRADLQTLARIHKGAGLTDLIKAGKLRIDGDINVLQRFSGYLKKLEFDLTEPVSKYIGDVPAHLLQTGFTQLRDKLKSISRGTTQHVTELAVEEYRLAPHRIEYIHFCDQLDDLSSDTAALEQRVARLKERYQG